MKQFTKSLFIVLSVLFSFSYAFAETGSETENNATGGGSKDVQVDGQSYYVAGTYIAGKGTIQKGDMTSKGFKLRTGSDGSRVIFSVNTNYSITSLVINGIANYNAKEEGAAIVVTKVEVDGVETTFEGGEFPGKAADTSGKLTISGIQAQQSIAIYFDNSNADGNQINAAWIVDWERPDATQPTITVSPKAINLVPEATTKLAVRVDPNTFTTAWVSDNEAVATVAEDGTVTAVAVGKANIINRWDTNADVADTAVVTVADFDPAKYEIAKQFDFTTLGEVTLTIEAEAAGAIWNQANSKPNNVFFCTNKGLEDIAVQAVLSSGKGWSITEAGLTLGSGAGRCAAIGHLKAGQVVEIIYTGSEFYTGSKEDPIRKDDGAVKTALNEGVGRAIYKMKEDGLFGFEITKGKAIEKIIVYEEPKEIVTVDDKQYKVVGENIITNGSFDEGVAGWYAGAWAAANADNYTLATEGGFDGGAYLQYSAGGVGSDKNIRGKWNVEIGKTYLFRCYTSGQKPTDANLQYSVLRIYDESLANYEGAALYQLKWGDADVWTENNFVFTATSNAVTFRSSWTENTKLDGFMLVEVERYFSPEGYNTALETAKNTLADENYAVVTGEERTTLANTIETYTNATADKYQEAIEALDAATNAFIAAAPAYEDLAAAKSDIQMVGYDARFPYATEAKKEAAQATLNAVAKTAAEATTMTAAIYKAYRQFAESHAMAEGVEGAVNMTDAITNPKAESAIAEPWKVVLGAGSGGGLDVKNAEPWTDGDDSSTHKYFDGGNWGANAWDVTMKQDITLPAGKYLMTVKSRASDGVMFSLFAANDTTGMPALGASGCLFNRGWNDTSLEFEVKEAGTVNIGVQGVADTQHQWMSFSDFRLVQLEATAPAFKPAYGTLWTEADGYSKTEEPEPYNYITLENKYFLDFAKVGDTIKVAISSVGNQPASSRPRIVTQGTLILKIDDAGETLDNIQQSETNANLILTEEEIAKIQEGADVVLSWKNMTVAQVDLIEKVEAVKTDYTDYIANADLTDSENKGWDDAGTKGIDGSGIVKASTGATFNFSQTIANLPAGKYKLTAQAAYRYSGSEADEYAAMQTDAITKFAQLYATVGTKNTNALVQNRYDGASDTDLAGEGAVQVNNLWVPNSSNAVKAWFAAGKYVNEVEFNLPADGDVKIGIVKTASPEAGDYTVIGPWTLTRLGDAEEEPEPETINPGDDVTKFIVNNSFETGDLTGWTVGSSSDTGVKPNSNGTYTTEGCDGDYLFNTWWQGIPITQTITNLPKGKYELKALMANDAITAGNKPCLYLLANGDHSEAFSSPNAGTFAEGTMEFYVTDGTATIGAIGGNADGSFTEAGYYWYKVDNFRLTFVEALPNIDDIEIPEGKMSNAAAQAIADAKAAGDVVALLEAVKVAKASIEAYAHLNGVLNELTDILEKTNVYTAEAKQTFDTAFNTAQTGYNDGTISDADAKAFNYGSRLEGLLPSLLLSAYTSTVNGTPYINTWSVEGNNDGTNYLTPFFEYWVGDTESLAENTITATMNDVAKGVYDVTAWVRVRIKNGAEAPATGIFFQVNDQTGESVVGEQLGNTQFYLKEMATNATVDTDGKLTIKFNVAAENNISWLAFKNVKFTFNKEKTDGIMNVNNAKNANDTIYNLNGQKVEKAKKGLYIINGKKVVVK